MTATAHFSIMALNRVMRNAWRPLRRFAAVVVALGLLAMLAVAVVQLSAVIDVARTHGVWAARDRLLGYDIRPPEAR
jgi:hypothetical protein